MKRLKCAVENCENNALCLYGDKWICGYCLTKVMEKEKEYKNKILESIK